MEERDMVEREMEEKESEIRDMVEGRVEKERAFEIVFGSYAGGNGLTVTTKNIKAQRFYHEEEGITQFTDSLGIVFALPTDTIITIERREV